MTTYNLCHSLRTGSYYIHDQIYCSIDKLDQVLIYNVVFSKKRAHAVIRYTHEPYCRNGIHEIVEIVGTYKSDRQALRDIDKLRKLFDGYYYAYVYPCDL